MFWTLELASHLEDAPWPATKDELIDYSIRSGAPIEVIENLQELEDEGEIYEGLEDIWPDYPSQEDFFFEQEGKHYLKYKQEKTERECIIPVKDKAWEILNKRGFNLARRTISKDRLRVNIPSSRNR